MNELRYLSGKKWLVLLEVHCSTSHTTSVQDIRLTYQEHAFPLLWRTAYSCQTKHPWCGQGFLDMDVFPKRKEFERVECHGVSTIIICKMYRNFPIRQRTHKNKLQLITSKYWMKAVLKSKLATFWHNSEINFICRLKLLKSSSFHVLEIWMPFYKYTLKMCSLLKIENNSSWVNFTYFREKTHALALEFIFISSSWSVYMHIKCNV